MSLGDEVVLPTHAAEHTAIFQLIGHPGTEQRHAERRVDEARIAPLVPLEFFLPVQLVDEADTGHGKPCALLKRHLPQPLVERLRPEEKATMQHRPLLIGRAP